MARPKLPILTRISNGLRDDTIDPMAVEDPRCWLWKGSLNTTGNPQLKNSQPPHRRLFELHIRTVPGMEDYVLPSYNPNETLSHVNYPKLGDEKSRTTNLVHNKILCGEQTCINPYHREWFGTRYGRPNDWGQEGDKPEELRGKVPPLPSLINHIPASTLLADITEWLREGPADQSFDEAFAEAQMDFCEHDPEDIHAALTEVMKCLKS